MEQLGITVFDVAVIVVAVFGALIGMSSGFAHAVLFIGSWIASGWIAWRYAKVVQPEVEQLVGSTELAYFLAMLAVFVAALIVLVMLGMLIAGQLVMTGTRFGRESRYVGSSRAAAETSGIHVPRLILLNFMVAAFAASIAGIFLTSMNKLGVFYLGQGYDFRAVTAVVIGGVMLSGGRGNMLGVLGGVLVIGLLTNIMTFCRITSFRQNIITGMVFILVVGLQQYRLRRGGRDAE